MQIGEMTLTSTQRVVFGKPAAEAIAAEAERIGSRRVFLLASATLREHTDEIAAIERALGDRHAATFSGIRPHAPRSDVLKAVEAARDANTDLIVTIGGGSGTDAGKIVALALKHDVRTVEDFEPLHVYVTDDGQVVNPCTTGPDIRVICVPTTLSGGEFNTLSGATDEVTMHKQGYEHRDMAPIAIILDPAITRHTPEWIWLSTGVRSVDHAVETLASDKSNDFADGLAEQRAAAAGRGPAAGQSRSGRSRRAAQMPDRRMAIDDLDHRRRADGREPCDRPHLGRHLRRPPRLLLVRHVALRPGVERRI